MMNEMKTNETNVSAQAIGVYLFSLVDKIYKILPLKEIEEPTNGKYIKALIREIIGMQELTVVLERDSRMMSVLSILQYMSSHINEMSVENVKSDVFQAINIVKKLRKRHWNGGGDQWELGTRTKS